MKKNNLLSNGSALIISSFFFLSLLITSCDVDNDDNDVAASGLMAFNLVPEAKVVGFALSGNTITGNNPFAFNNYTGTYLSVYSGQRQVQSYNYGAGGTIASSTFNFEPDQYYSLFLVGTDPNYEHVIVKDSLDNLSTSTQAFVRYINAIPDASSPTVTVTVNSNNVVNETASFKTVSAFKAIDAGSVTITVSNGGTINVTRTITLEQKKVYTILLSGKPGNTGDTAVQIKYIVNGTVDETAGRTTSMAIQSLN